MLLTQKSKGFDFFSAISVLSRLIVYLRSKRFCGLEFLYETLSIVQVKLFGEGEALRYFEHAEVLRETMEFFRETHELDLLRCESLMSLDHQSRLRVLRKNYM